MRFVVRDWRHDTQSDGTHISAQIADMRVGFHLPPGVAGSEYADPFLSIALLPAMAAHADLDLLAMPPVSDELLSHLDLIQEIWTTWNSALRRIEVRAHSAPPVAPLFNGTAAFFSGGVDALYTALERRTEIDRLVFINGFDFKLNPEAATAAFRRVQRQADKLGIPAIMMSTNWIDFVRRHKVSRDATFGSALGAIGQLLAPARMLVSTSYSFARLKPSGSNVLVDPLWSNGTMRLELIGADSRRDEKELRIAQEPEFLSDLWVCWDDPVRNCGVCDKCLRLRVSLALNGRERDVYPNVTGDAIAAWCRIVSSGEATYLGELSQAAIEVGRYDAVWQFEKAAQRIRVRRALRSADEALLGGRIARWRNRNRGSIDLRATGPEPLVS